MKLSAAFGFARHFICSYHGKYTINPVYFRTLGLLSFQCSCIATISEWKISWPACTFGITSLIPTNTNSHNAFAMLDQKKTWCLGLFGGMLCLCTENGVGLWTSGLGWLAAIKRICHDCTRSVLVIIIMTISNLTVRKEVVSFRGRALRSTGLHLLEVLWTSSLTLPGACPFPLCISSSKVSSFKNCDNCCNCLLPTVSCKSGLIEFPQSWQGEAGT